MHLSSHSCTQPSLAYPHPCTPTLTHTPALPGIHLYPYIPFTPWYTLIHQLFPVRSEKWPTWNMWVRPYCLPVAWLSKPSEVRHHLSFQHSTLTYVLSLYAAQRCSPLECGVPSCPGFADASSPSPFSSPHVLPEVWASASASQSSLGLSTQEPTAHVLTLLLANQYCSPQQLGSSTGS